MEDSEAGGEAQLRSCAVTGANGFIGSQVVRELLRRGYEVTALVGADLGVENLAGLPIKVREFDLLDPASVRAGLAGNEAVVHSAACYAFWLPDPRQIYRVNVEGTRNVLAATRELGCRKLVYTSSTATLSPPFRAEEKAGELGNEDNVLDLRRFRGHYKMSKAMAEVVALREAARGLPLVIVHPTTVLGPGDLRPTPSGSMLVHFLNGNMKAYTNLMQNLVDVRDVATGHVLALEKARPGERYVLGGENIAMRDIVRLLAEITGLPAPWFAIPHPVLHVMSLINEWISDHITHRLPIAPLEAKLHAVDSRPVDTSKARRELGFVARPARQVLIDAVRWFVQEGYCPAATAQRIAQQPAFREA
jgi:dihydroflavonol-4-reductase